MIKRLTKSKDENTRFLQTKSYYAHPPLNEKKKYVYRFDFVAFVWYLTSLYVLITDSQSW